MKRFLIFVILGPIIGLAVVLAIFSFKSGVFDPDVRMVSIGLPLAYSIGAVPALFAAVVDWSLATTFRFWIRVGATCCAGYALAVVTWLVMSKLIVPYASFGDVFVFGFYGAIPAAICSWLSGAKK
jgi:hypothetical protein